MRTISIAVAALISKSSAITQKTAGAPDVYGPNGTDYANTDAVYDLSRIGIDVLSRDAAVHEGDGKQCD